MKRNRFNLPIWSRFSHNVYHSKKKWTSTYHSIILWADVIGMDHIGWKNGYAALNKTDLWHVGARVVLGVQIEKLMFTVHAYFSCAAHAWWHGEGGGDLCSISPFDWPVYARHDWASCGNMTPDRDWISCVLITPLWCRLLHKFVFKQ